jgi:hypothetical protein
LVDLVGETKALCLGRTTSPPMLRRGPKPGMLNLSASDAERMGQCNGPFQWRGQSMTKLDQFEAELRHLIGQSTKVRPFVCNGSPLACKGFIVGFNPATEMAADFWDFWRSGFGFDRAAWFAEYKADRQRRPLRPGKKSRPAVSNSRRVMEWVIEEAAPIAILETNIFGLPTPKATDLPPGDRDTSPFDLLMKRVKPDVIVVHGNEAREKLREREIAGILIEEKHFSRGWSEADARALGRRIKQACGEVS